ncbi:MAG: multicopper oxidase domain-containing protein [Gammaproteobacteria bacterium]|nr:multicopper oxidase domain-containing protein [Gammaproteobacteria bacterium]
MLKHKWIYTLFVYGTIFSICTLPVQADDDDDENRPQVREYWVSAKKVNWDYAPSGINKIKPDEGLGPWGATTQYTKYRYFAHSKNFARELPQAQHRGILGPELRAVEGDTIKIHFRNDADKPLTMHPHGVRYTPQHDGADYALSGQAGAKVLPGQTHTYIWHADKDASPGPNDESSIVWAYHSHVDSVTEIYDGLIGTIVITKAGMQRSKYDPRPKDVDKEFSTLFMVFNEEDGEEGGLMHAMNGYIFGNLEGYVVNKHDRVRWYLVAMGTEVDLHTAHWHGQTVLDQGRRTDVVELLPTSMKTVTMKASNPGTWLYHCHVTDHITAGMMARWTVLP